MPAISTEGASLIAAAITLGLPIAAWIKEKTKSREIRRRGGDPSSGWTTIDRKLGAVLGKLKALENLPKQVEELLALRHAETTERAVKEALDQDLRQSIKEIRTAVMRIRASGGTRD